MQWCSEDDSTLGMGWDLPCSHPAEEERGRDDSDEANETTATAGDELLHNCRCGGRLIPTIRPWATGANIEQRQVEECAIVRGDGAARAKRTWTPA
jgi:hypothetical protein